MSVVAFLIAAVSVGQAQVPITLNQGWNWISYPYTEPMTISEALSGFTPAEGDILKSQSDGFAQYQNGTWTDSLTTLVPGQGYHYESVSGIVKSFVFGGTANDPSALPEEALPGEFTIASNGTKVRFSPGNLQCRIDPNKESRAIVGTGTSTSYQMPYNTYYNYSLCQMIYKAGELHAAGLGFGTLTSIAFESYSTNHYQRDGFTVWVSNTTLTTVPSTSVVTSEMTQVFSGSMVQQDGWTIIPFSTPFSWDGESNLMVTVVMNHGSYNSTTYWQCSSPGFTCSSYNYNDSNPYNPVLTTYSMNTSSNRPNTRFNGKGGTIWRFAERQWDRIGANNAYISNSYNGWIDLFGWGTSGHPHGANCYQPWSTSTTGSDYQAYGGSYNLFDQTGEADWGCNAISNGGDKPNQWRTLDGSEWLYMFNGRSTPSGIRYAKAKVNGVCGLILLPDNWSTSYYSLSNTNTASAAFTSNTISASQWPTLEQHGAVFLPAAGARVENTVVNNNTTGAYWSSLRSGTLEAYYVVFGDGALAVQSFTYAAGFSVRLVCQSNPRIRTLGMSGVSATGATVSAEADFTGTVSTRGVCWNTSGAPTVSDTYYYAGTGTGGFIAQMTGLQPNTTYYVRAYAKISGTYRYGNTLTFTTSEQLAVSTAEVTGITGTFAQCGGTVTGGGQGVTARGLCWGTTNNPTVSGNHTYEGRGEGGFSSMVDNLTEGTTYYVRAYATTAEGTVYGNERSFYASNVLEVTTATVTNVTNTSAICGGTVNNNGGNNAIIARGLCWGTGSYPTVSGSHTTNGTGSGSFTVYLTGLQPGTTYYVRAYATTADGTSYGSQWSFKPTVPTGAIKGLFSVSATQQVFFSQGNLQYIGSASTPYWKFADHQWDALGTTTGQNSNNQNVDRDLFGWGTSGYNHGAVCYQPWSTSQTNSDYYAYGSATYNLYDQTGKAEWGYNAISNGGNQTNQWRTLTSAEWGYVFNTRSTASGIRYAKAKVNDVNGMILLPDDWSASYYTLSNTNTSSASFSSNTITASQWSTLEQHGAVFLPAAGIRYGTLFDYLGIKGRYWSASYGNSSTVHYVYFDGSSLYPQDLDYRFIGLSVRLVRSVQ